MVLLIGYEVLRMLGGSRFRDHGLEPVTVVQMPLLLLVMAQLASPATRIYCSRQVE